MVESMACGTPVAAIGLGAVPEVVDRRPQRDRRPTTVAGLIARLARGDRARPGRGRAATPATRFSAERMVGDYEAAYEQLLSEDRP